MQQNDRAMQTSEVSLKTIGDTPTAGRWRLPAAAIAWVAWLGFLTAMWLAQTPSRPG